MSVPFQPTDDEIDDIIATCNGDLRGAVKALLMVNEQLESELQQLYAAAAQSTPATQSAPRRSNNVLH